MCLFNSHLIAVWTCTRCLVNGFTYDAILLLEQAMMADLPGSSTVVLRALKCLSDTTSLLCSDVSFSHTATRVNAVWFDISNIVAASQGYFWCAGRMMSRNTWAYLLPRKSARRGYRRPSSSPIDLSVEQKNNTYIFIILCYLQQKISKKQNNSHRYYVSRLCHRNRYPFIKNALRSGKNLHY